MKKVIPRILGGIGNQLFSYAAARRLSLIHGAELAIDHVSGFERDFVYKQQYQLDHFSIPCRKATAWERLEPFSRYRRFLLRKTNQKRNFEQRNYLVQSGNDFDSRLLHIKPSGTMFLEGYWQSEEYFKDIEKTIRCDLKIIPPKDSLNLDLATKMRNCIAVAVHVRFFDHPTELGINNAPENYYERAVEKMETLVPDAHYFLFSDKIDAARARISLPDSRVTCVNHNQGDQNAYADLWLMTQSQHFIIANSTFSWWGAWLSENSGKHVIAPGFVMKEGKTAWGFKGLIPDSWIKL